MTRQPSLDADLFESGIRTERSDIRAHVAVTNRAIYVFRTQHGLEAIDRVRPELRPASQPGVSGVTVGVGDADRRHHGSAGGRSSVLAWLEGFTEALRTSDKGARAVACVQYAMRRRQALNAYR